MNTNNHESIKYLKFQILYAKKQACRILKTYVDKSGFSDASKAFRLPQKKIERLCKNCKPDIETAIKILETDVKIKEG